MEKTIELEIESIMYSIDEEVRDVKSCKQIAEKLITQITAEIEKFCEYNFEDYRVIIIDDYSCSYENSKVDLSKLVVELKALESVCVKFSSISIYFDDKIIEAELG